MEKADKKEKKEKEKKSTKAKEDKKDKKEKDKKEKKDKKDKKDTKDKEEPKRKDSKGSKGSRDSSSSSDSKENKHKGNRSLTTVSWSIPTILPGPSTTIEQRSSSPPEISVYNGIAYVAFRNFSNDAIWINYSSDGTTWNGSNSYAVTKSLTRSEEDEDIEPEPEPETTLADNKIYTLYRPALTPYNGAIYLSYTQKSNSVIQLSRSVTPANPGWKILPAAPIGTALAISEPSIAAWTNSRLYVAYTDNTNRIMVGNFNANVSTNQWSSFAPVKDTNGNDYKTTDGPCLWSVTSGTINFRLYITFRATNVLFIGYAVFDPSGNGAITSWTPVTLDVVGPFSIIDTPQITQYNNDFYLAIAGPKKDIQYGSSSTEGATWGNWGEIDNATNGSPSIVQKGPLLLMAFTQLSNDTAKTFVMTSFATITTN